MVFLKYDEDVVKKKDSLSSGEICGNIHQWIVTIYGICFKIWGGGEWN